MGCLSLKPRTTPKVSVIHTQAKTEEASTIHLLVRPGMFISKKEGSIITEYEFGKLLGVGSYGKVHQAVHKISGEIRAIKTVMKRSVTKDQLENAIYFNEIDIMRVLNHPNVTKMYEFYEDSRNYYLVTEFMAGGEFFDYILSSSFLSEAIAGHFFRQLLNAVNYCHSLNIVHRDLKPENLLLDAASDSATLKLIDFGAASFIQPGCFLTQPHGSAYYIAPEVLSKRYNEKCDMWSCGVILYILLSGKPPFVGSTDSEILENVRRGEFTFSGRHWKGVSSSAKSLISSLLTMNPNSRFSARQALHHEWMTTHSMTYVNAINDTYFASVLGNLSKFSTSRKLQNAVMTFIVSQTTTKLETKSLVAAFKRIDSNGDGRISREELFIEYEKMMGSVRAQQEVDWIMEQVDIDKSGYIDYSEFVLAASTKEELINKTTLEACFRNFDRDSSGSISANELKTILGEGVPQDSETWNQLIAEVDMNGDGEIDLEEFKSMMMRLI